MCLGTWFAVTASELHTEEQGSPYCTSSERDPRTCAKHATHRRPSTVPSSKHVKSRPCGRAMALDQCAVNRAARLTASAKGTSQSPAGFFSMNRARGVVQCSTTGASETETEMRTAKRKRRVTPTIKQTQRKNQCPKRKMITNDEHTPKNMTSTESEALVVEKTMKDSTVESTVNKKKYVYIYITFYSRSLYGLLYCPVWAPLWA